jgi:hypothetical protein
VTADRPRRSIRGLALAAIGLLSSGCASGPSVHIDNMTNTRMEVHVNGTAAGDFGPGGSGDVSLGGHGAPPYQVTVHSPSGDNMMQIVLTAEDIKRIADTSGYLSAGTTGIPCGEIRLSMGRIDAPAPGPPGVDQMPACP